MSRAKGRAMNVRLSIDRFEGPRKEIAVLLFEDGRTILIPRDFLPKGARAGEAMLMSLERDPQGTIDLARKAKAIRDALKPTDPGGDIQL